MVFVLRSNNSKLLTKKLRQFCQELRIPLSFAMFGLTSNVSAHFGLNNDFATIKNVMYASVIIMKYLISGRLQNNSNNLKTNVISYPTLHFKIHKNKLNQIVQQLKMSGVLMRLLMIGPKNNKTLCPLT